jgi:aspartyl protease family protein
MRLLLLLLMMACGCASAQTVSMSGSLGDKALLIIDGAPRTVATGATVQGVKLIHVGSGDAVVEVKGQRLTLQLGGSQVNIGGKPSDGGGTQIVLSANSGGHFIANGSINGRSVTFMVDTGATFVSMGADEAERLGVAYANGQRGMSSTANGNMVVYRVKLASVRIGDVVLYDIDALVSREPMRAVLLGNSYLTHFQMKRENDQMTLTKRY